METAVFCYRLQHPEERWALQDIDSMSLAQDFTATAWRAGTRRQPSNQRATRQKESSRAA